MNITLKQLTYFIALAEARNFGRAAAKVNVTQPALSVQIRELEDRLDAVLVERQPRDVVLTPTGHDVLRHANRVMTQMTDLTDSARLRDGLTGRLTLGVIPTVAPYLLPVALPMLRAKNLTLDLRVRESRTDRLIEELNNGTLDAAVIALPSGVPTLVEQVLFTDRFLLAGSKTQISTLAAAPDELRPTTLDPDRLLLLEEGHCLSDQALEVCAMERAQTRVDLSASSLATLCRLVAEGFGLTFLPEIALASECKAVPDMATLRFSEPQPSRRIGLVRRKSNTGGGWFEELADTLSCAGKSLLP
ncbi:MAG: LysR family transcriptional regulator [Marinosulfonomonas sp.]|nr:MAG: LysR family transcriptional regulator [Marinosulfonomonas sp.]